MWPPGWASGHDNFQNTLLAGLLRQDRHPIVVLETVGSQAPPLEPPHVVHPVAMPVWRGLKLKWEQQIYALGDAALRATRAEAVIGCAHMPMPQPPGIAVIPTVYESDFGFGLPWHIVGARWTYDNHRRLRRAFDDASGVIAISDYTARCLVADFGLAPDRIAIAPPAVPDFGVAIEPTPGGDPYVAVVGWLHPREGIRFAIRAWAAARAKGLPHKLVLIGKAASADAVEGDVARMVVDETGPYRGDVRWTGLIPRADYGRVLANADALLVTSLQEGFGIAVIEAASVGTPTVATDSGALPEVAAPAGAIVPRDLDTVSDALIRVTANPPSADALRAYAATFTIERQAHDVIRLLDRLERERRSNAAPIGSPAARAATN
jgi:glycosyltransferase involved in cell wall biosynthesis